MSLYGSWSKCSKTCGYGGSQKSVRRVVRKPRYGGVLCSQVFEQSRTCTDGPCPVHCKVGRWTSWSKCSRACGAGTRFSTRKVLKLPKHGGYVCPSIKRTQSCKVKFCKVDCKVSAWSAWNKCSRSCGKGYKNRGRRITRRTQHGGNKCPILREIRPCGFPICPIDCVMTVWGGYSPCSKSCGIGMKIRRRSVAVVNGYGGKRCGTKFGISRCNAAQCPVDCRVLGWGAWKKCSRKCAGGHTTRKRHIQTYQWFGGKRCPTTWQHKTCNAHQCPVTCILSKWSRFSACSRTCGTGMARRTRTILRRAINGAPRCQPTSQSKICNLKACPVNCLVSEFGKYHKCTVGCGGGFRYQYRRVIRSPAYGGRACPSLRSKGHRCNLHHCPVHCKVTSYKNWGKCSRSCGKGIMLRKRRIVVKSKHGGRRCPTLSEARTCNVHVCPVDCNVRPWTAYSICTKSCGMGFKFRTRKMTAPKHGGKACPARRVITFCNKRSCPQPCAMSGWSSFKACTKSCGGGLKTRSRTVKKAAKFGGRKCGPKYQRHRCNMGACPENCRVGPWTPWSRCVVSLRRQRILKCGKGIRFRTRLPIGTYKYGGKRCPSLQVNAPCDLGQCSVNCRVTDWTYWGKCSRTCGKGRRSRARKIITKTHNAKCPALAEYQACSTKSCPIDCQQSGWGVWQACSKSCWDGHEKTVRDRLCQIYPTQKRFRKVTRNPRYGGKACQPASMKRTCNKHRCSIDCVVSPWASWSRCSQTCNEGTQHRTRRVVKKSSFGGKSCFGGSVTYTDVRKCKLRSCPFDCKVTKWTKFTRCTVSCEQSMWMKSKNLGGWHMRERKVVVKSRPGGRSCPHLGERLRCNSRSYCIRVMGLKTGTNAPTPAVKDSLWKKNKMTYTEKNISKKKRTRAPTPSPTPYATRYRSKKCRNGPRKVPSGWHGAGYGRKYCNLCKCTDGLLTCQRKKCGKRRPNAKTCSKTYCRFVYSYVAKHKILRVTSHHLETKGANHDCQYNYFTGSCKCQCWGKGFPRWRRRGRPDRRGHLGPFSVENIRSGLMSLSSRSARKVSK